MHHIVSSEIALANFFLGMPEWGKTRIRSGSSESGSTFPLPIKKIAEYCAKHPKQKLYAMPGVIRNSKVLDPTKVDKNGRKRTYISQADWATDQVAWRTVDMDTPSVATIEQVEQISNLLPDSVLTWSHGVQVRLVPSGEWRKDALKLKLIGEKLEELTGLHYDAHQWNNDEWEAYHAQGHLYRLPVGWCPRANRPPIALHPLGDDFMTVDQAFEALGCVMSEVVKKKVAHETKIPTRRRATRSPRMTVTSVRGKGTGGSQGEKHGEFGEALSALGKLKFQGLSREDAYAQVCAMPWTHLKADELVKSFDRYVVDWSVALGKGGSFVSNAADQEIFHSYLIDKVTNRQKYFQKTTCLFAHRAWAMDIFYGAGFTSEEAIYAFLRWKAFRRLRRLSIKALGGDLAGRRYLRADLTRVYDKFSTAATPIADPALVAGVLDFCHSFPAYFRSSDIPLTTVGVQSQRHLRRILGMLTEAGELTKSGKTKNTVYRIKSLPQTPSNHITNQQTNTLCMAESFSSITAPILPMKTTPPFPRDRFLEPLSERDSQSFYEYMIKLPIDELRRMENRLKSELKKDPESFALHRELGEVKVGLKSAIQLHDDRKRFLKGKSKNIVEAIAADATHEDYAAACELIRAAHVTSEAKRMAAELSLDQIHEHAARIKELKKDLHKNDGDIREELNGFLEVAMAAEKLILAPTVAARRAEGRMKRAAAWNNARYQSHIVGKREEEEKKAESLGYSSSEAHRIAREALPQFFKPRKYAT